MNTQANVSGATGQNSLASEQNGLNGELLQLLVDNVRDYAIIFLDTNGSVLTWNSAAQRLKGWTAEEIIGQHFSRFYPPEEIQKGKTEMELKIAAQEGRARQPADPATHGAAVGTRRGNWLVRRIAGHHGRPHD
jgi:PAS domain S-box-containing protein